MTVEAYNPRTVQNFIGLSTDTKPAIGNGLTGARPGAKFFAQDTKHLFILGTDGTWVDITGAAVTSSVTI